MTGPWLEDAFRVDLVVENSVIIEVKSVPAVAAAHRKQLPTYLRLPSAERDDNPDIRRVDNVLKLR